MLLDTPLRLVSGGPFGGDEALNSDDATVVVGMKSKSEEFKAQGGKVYLPVVD